MIKKGIRTTTMKMSEYFRNTMAIVISNVRCITKLAVGVRTKIVM